MKYFELPLKFLNALDVPLPLMNPDEITVKFPMESGRIMERRLSQSGVRIKNDAQGEAVVKLTDFDIQGMIEAEAQTFEAIIERNGTKTQVVFTRGLNVRTLKQGDGSITKVLGGANEIRN